MLNEDQIIRYSRQILLLPIGGKGQARLLGVGATLTGEGAALCAAAAYLAAGGTPIRAPPRPMSAEEAGFLLAEADRARPFGAMLRASLTDLNPDALAEPALRGTLGELPAAFTGPAPWVALGWSGRRGAVVFRGEDGCAGCFEACAGSLSNGPAGASSVLLGAWGALAFQRLVLGVSAGLGGLWVNEEGTVSSMDLARCPAHPAVS